MIRRNQKWSYLVIFWVELQLRWPGNGIHIWSMAFGQQMECSERQYRKEVNKLFPGDFRVGIFMNLSSAYFNSVSWNIYHHGSPQCAGALSKAFRTIVASTEQRNSTKLNQLLNLCDNLNFNNPQQAPFLYRSLFTLVSFYIEQRK